MFDFDTKFDRRECPISLEINAIRKLVEPYTASSKIESAYLLTGGFVNSNYRLILCDQRSMVLRISAKSADLRKELRVLNHVQGRVPVPEIIAEDFSNHFSFALLQFIEGDLLSDCIGPLDVKELREISFQAGIVLRSIHSFDLGKAGFFNADFSFHPEFENFGLSIYDYIHSCLLSGRTRARLGAGFADQVLTFLQGKQSIYQTIPNATRLIHCDYNLKNILVKRTGRTISGILDWEFAAAGSPLVDIGNFLRFADELPQGFVESFIEGYGLADLPNNWREIAKLLDLAAMTNFLESEGEAPKTFRTAISVIRKTVETIGE
ncbi:MAG: aminoglycoside phosphotransferase family protein [Verrucomicrobia bacterium]|nr:aminoglycoside phosphotransferase family protein [Verrucomicrobiota bacterium]